MPITFKSAKLVLLSTVRFSSIKTSLLLTFTSPDALILRSWLVLLTCILLLFIVISSVVNVVNVVCPETVTGPVVVVLSLNSVLLILTNSSVVTSPVPAARNSKSLLLTVVEIKLSSITIFSNWVRPSWPRLPCISKFLIVKSVAVISASTSIVATCKFWNVDVPPTVISLPIPTSSVMFTLPVPLGLNSKSALLSVVVIKFVSIVIPFKSASFIYAKFQRLSSLPNVKVSCWLGSKSWLNSVLNVTVSVGWLPANESVPSNVKLSVISKLPVRLVLAFKFINVDTGLSIVMPPLRLSIVLPLNLIFWFCTFVPSIIAMLPFVVTVSPASASTVDSSIVNVLFPVSRSTKNCSPTLKFPKWSVELKYIVPEFNSSVSFTCIALLGSLSTNFPAPMYPKLCWIRYINVSAPSATAPLFPYTFADPIDLNSAP